MKPCLLLLVLAGVVAVAVATSACDRGWNLVDCPGELCAADEAQCAAQCGSASDGNEALVYQFNAANTTSPGSVEDLAGSVGPLDTSGDATGSVIGRTRPYRGNGLERHDAPPGTFQRSLSLASSLVTAITEANQLTIEAWVTPDVAPTPAPAGARFLTAADPAGAPGCANEVFYLQQSGNDLIFGLRVDQGGDTCFTATATNQGLSEKNVNEFTLASVHKLDNWQPRPYHIVVSYDGDSAALRVFVNVDQVLFDPNIDGHGATTFELWNQTSPQVIIGNPFATDQAEQWPGTVHSLLVHSIAFTPADVDAAFQRGPEYHRADSRGYCGTPPPFDYALAAFIVGVSAGITFVVWATVKVARATPEQRKTWMKSIMFRNTVKMDSTYIPTQDTIQGKVPGRSAAPSDALPVRKGSKSRPRKGSKQRPAGRSASNARDPDGSRRQKYDPLSLEFSRPQGYK